jgi:AcrR family transcriptional regulator
MRKKPSQARSREMVDALLAATAQTIAERGVADTTTNHIARRAHVSVGSLYQYFASKEALLDALINKMQADLTRAVDAQLKSLLDADVRTLIRAMLNAVFGFFETNQGLYLELARNWYNARTIRSVDALESYMTEAFRLYLLRHHGKLRIENLPLALFITFNSTVFTGMRYLSQPHPHLKREEVIEGLTEMVAGYLLSAGAIDRRE